MRSKIIIIVLLFPLVLLAGYPHKAHSVLASGKWFRISLQKTGIYKITYDDFVAMGFDPATLDPSKISVYGNGGGMLPESNATSRPDDLIENAIEVHDGGDGKLDPGDYVLFYGMSPDIWVLDPLTFQFSHQKNLYSDSTYYYVTVGSVAGKRVQQVPSLTDTALTHTLAFIDHAFHEIDSVNLTQSGEDLGRRKFLELQDLKQYLLRLSSHRFNGNGNNNHSCACSIDPFKFIYVIG